MQLLEFLVLSLVAGLLANVAALPVGLAEKRAIVTVIETVTAPRPNAQTLAANPTTPNIVFPTATTPAAAPVAETTPPAVVTPAATTPAAVAPAAADNTVQAAAPAATTKSGPFAFLFNLFDDFDSDDTAAATTQPAVATQAAAATQPTTAPSSSSSSSSSNGFFSSLFGGLSDLFGFGSPSSSSSSSGTSTGTAATNVIPVSPAASNSNSGSTGTSGGTGTSGSVAEWYSLTSQGSIPTDVTTGSYNSKYAVGSKGITYSPYQKSGSCKTAQMVAEDMAKLSAFSVIRLYSTDCNGIENVLANIDSSQKVFLGIWNIDSASVVSGMQAIESAIKTTSRGWSAVDTIAIGNEQVNSGDGTVAQVQAGLAAARNWIKQNPGYTGPVVSVDTLIAVINNPALCSASDYLAVNCHPYFTGSVSPSDSGKWLLSRIAALKSVCGEDKQVVITETGWPTAGNSIGTCVPSKQNQATALQSLVSSLGDQMFAFTMYNDYWKSPGPYDIEQSWGIFGNPEF